MESGSGLYDDVVSVYIKGIKRESPEAAAAIEEIVSLCGSRAALRATLVITLLKIEVQKAHSVENIDVQIHLLKDFPEARPLLERAITYCVEAWETARVAAAKQTNGNLAASDGGVKPSTPELPLA